MVLWRHLLAGVRADAVCVTSTGCSAPGHPSTSPPTARATSTSSAPAPGSAQSQSATPPLSAVSTTFALSPPDADNPAAGVCGAADGALVTVVANPDTPAPRCLIVTANQRLRVVNDSNGFGQPGKPMTVRFAGFALRAVPGEATLFDRPLGELIAPGVHYIRISLYPGTGGAEVWLKP